MAPLPELACAPTEIRKPTEPISVPPLFGTYLRYGALVCSPPAIDRDFKTIDYLVLHDRATLPPRTRELFYGE